MLSPWKKKGLNSLALFIAVAQLVPTRLGHGTHGDPTFLLCWRKIKKKAKLKNWNNEAT